MTVGPPYDPDLRRDTPLARKLKERIRREGPISVAQYMEACLQDPEHGYYRTKAAIGAQGDFITAPEISQVFGELIGLWCAVVWQQMGSPERFNLVEFGPGRGTLMRDALRAAKVLPAFRTAIDLHFIESSATLREIQAATLATTGTNPVWHEDLTTLPSGTATIIVANEFLDAVPASQLEVISRGRARLRGVGLDAHSQLRFVSIGESTPIPDGLAATGSLGETRDLFFLRQVNRLMQNAPAAALFIDYGYVETQFGDTLQAVRGHAAEHPLTSPGEADLTVHVDFAALRLMLEMPIDVEGWPAATIDGPVTQAEFLGRLGILPRASRLMAANPASAHQIEVGVARLMAVPGMGDRFKVLGIRSASLPQLPGFPSSDYS